MEAIRIKQWFQTDFSATVKVNGKILDLTWYTAEFIMINNNSVIKTQKAVAIDNPTSWIITYIPDANDVDEIWLFKAYFAISKNWVKKLSAPTDFFQVEIIKDV